MKFSVLLSIYASEKASYLDECLSSLWHKQTKRPDDIVLVLDGPIPLPLEQVVGKWIEQLGEVLQIVRLAKNSGLGNALRTGLGVCRYDLVARIDADDIVMPNRFAVQTIFMQENPNIDVLGSSAHLINAKGDLIGCRHMPSNNNDIRRLIWSCPVIHPSVMLRRHRIEAIGSYNSELPSRQEDYELWIRAARCGLRFHNLSDMLICYRVASTKKNTWTVGWNRLKIGLSAVNEFNPTPLAYLALFYPVIRSLLPHKTFLYIDRITSRIDPRNNIS